MREEILQLIRNNNYEVDKEIEFFVEQLSDVLKAKKENSDVNSIVEWLNKKRRDYPVKTDEIGLKELEKWHIDENSGNVYHDSGKFFSVIGVKVGGADDREVPSWTQPMIKQQECGILGILCKKINGTMHYLLQAKYEPGNTRTLQLSPTLQATESNLKQAHQGKKPLLAEYFEEGDKGKIITSVISVEDGGRFYLKTNRNMIVEVDEGEEVSVPDSFIWVNQYQLKKLLKRDLEVNSLVRSILGSV